MNNNDFDYKYHYNNWHTDTEESLKNDKLMFARLFEQHSLFPEDKNSKILELGCGMGRCLSMLSEHGYNNLTGIDIDRSQVNIAQKSGLNIILDDIESFFRKSDLLYDCIFGFDILEHLEKDRQLAVLRLIESHLSDRGMVVFQIPNAMSPTADYFRYTDFTHCVSYTDITMKFLLLNAGLKYIVVRPQLQETMEVQELKLPWAKLYRNEFLLDSFILTPNIVAVAFKDKECMDNYLSKVPAIVNNYSEAEINNQKRPKKKWWKFFL